MQIITANELNRIKNDENCLIIDANWYLPTEKTTGLAEYQKQHIENARFFDIDSCCDSSSPLPHSLPRAEIFQKTMRALGAKNDSHIVVYDRMGYFSAPRLYWMLGYFGHEKAAILDGGLQAWQNEDLPVTDALPQVIEGNFTARANHSMCADRQDILQKLGSNFTLLDARPSARFLGQVPEPRPGLRAGHIPGALNVPYDSLFDANGLFKSKAQLQKIMQDKLPANKSDEVICSCGSGVTACTVILALEILGYDNVKLYDGSWSEWGADENLPIE